MTNTKQNIINSAVTLFNEKGFTNVSMKDIADFLNISPGNLTYHFPRKEMLIETIHEQISQERKEIYNSIKDLPSFRSIQAIIEPLMNLYVKYKFFYTNTLDIVREYPRIHRRNKEEIKQQIGYIREVIKFSVKTGNMKPEVLQGQHDQLAMNSLMIFNGWIQYQFLIDEPNHDYNGVQFATWNLVIPMLTPKGLNNLSRIVPELAEQTIEIL